MKSVRCCVYVLLRSALFNTIRPARNAPMPSTGCRSVARCSSGPSRSARPHRHASLRRMPPFCCQEATAGCRRLRKMRFPHTTASSIHASTVSPDRSSFARSSHIAPRLRPRRPVPARGRGDRGGILPKDRKVAVSGWASDPAWGSGQELAWGSGLELASDPGPFSIRNRPSCCRLNYPYCRNYCSNRLSCRNYRNCCSCSNCRSFRNYRNCRYLRNCRIRHPIPNRRKMLPVLLR